MAFVTKVLGKILGNKSERDIKEISQIVDEIKVEYERIVKLSKDKLREESEKLKKIIKDHIKPEEDEIAGLNLNLQAKLLRVLKEREITRIGSNITKSIDVRIIVASRKNLAHEVDNGNFMEDLYFHLSGLPIQLPPLREREGDILILAKYFVEAFCQLNNMPLKGFTELGRQKLLTYSYPGNVRELKSVVELSAALAEGLNIDDEDISFSSNGKIKDVFSHEKTLKDHNIDIIQHYLDKYNGDVLLVADKLDIGKSTIYKMIKSEELLHQKNNYRKTSNSYIRRFF